MAGIGRQFVINLLANSRPATKAFEDVGKAVGRIGIPVAAAVAGITAGFVAIGVSIKRVGEALLDLGEEFNSAYATIRAGTGAVGDEFERLQDSFRNVARNVSDPFDDVAAALTEVDRRMDLMSNRRLERVTQQFLDLAGLTGGDVVGTIREASRMMNRFGVEAHMTSDFLDFLLKASSATGITIEQLGAQTSNYGVGLQRLGFSLEESIVFLGMLEREGAAVSRIFPALNTAAGKLAREGTGDVRQGLADLIDELRDLDEAAANARAAEMLGADYGNFLEIIRSNRLDFDGLMQQIEDSDLTVTDAAAEADTLTDAWNNFKNFLKLELEGPATAVFGNIREVIRSLKGVAMEVQEAYAEEGLAGALEVVADEWNRIYRTYLEPLWVAFLAFLNDIVVPAAVELGKKIGGAIVSGIGNALVRGLENIVIRGVAGRAGAEFEELRGILDASRELEMGVDNRSLDEILAQLGYDIAIRSALAGGLPANIPGLAAGGVVTSPTLAVVGEAGPEAVIPLDRMGEMGGGTVVNVTVTSADPQAVVDAIRRYTRSNGPLGQVVAV